jgi:hypothetical protein
MKQFWIPVCFLLSIALLGMSLYFWGGVATHPEMGAYFREHVSTYSFTLWVYSAAGAKVVTGLGVQANAADYVAHYLGGVLPVIKSAPFSAMDALFKATPWKIKIANYLGPILFLTAVFAQTRKPKTFKTFG